MKTREGVGSYEFSLRGCGCVRCLFGRLMRGGCGVFRVDLCFERESYPGF